LQMKVSCLVLHDKDSYLLSNRSFGVSKILSAC
jgi:hypothetical protein